MPNGNARGCRCLFSNQVQMMKSVCRTVGLVMLMSAMASAGDEVVIRDAASLRRMVGQLKPGMTLKIAPAIIQVGIMCPMSKD